jgi:hypothetical protein
MTAQEYNQRMNRLFDEMITSSRDSRPCIDREIKRLKAQAKKEGLI